MDISGRTGNLFYNRGKRKEEGKFYEKYRKNDNICLTNKWADGTIIFKWIEAEWKNKKEKMKFELVK